MTQPVADRDPRPRTAAWTEALCFLQATKQTCSSEPLG